MANARGSRQHFRQSIIGAWWHLWIDRTDPGYCEILAYYRDDKDPPKVQSDREVTFHLVENKQRTVTAIELKCQGHTEHLTVDNAKHVFDYSEKAP